MSQCTALHGKAMNLSDRAAAAFKRGEEERAKILYKNASDVELQALLICDPANTRTVMILRNSLDALRAKAKDPRPVGMQEE